MTLAVTHHAVKRYCERVKPHLGQEQARLELAAISEFAERVVKPWWFLGHQKADHYLQVGPEAVAAVVDCKIVTVVTREAVDEEWRAKRNHWKARRRHRRAMKRKEFKRKYHHRPEIEEGAA